MYMNKYILKFLEVKLLSQVVCVHLKVSDIAQLPSKEFVPINTPGEHF